MNVHSAKMGEMWQPQIRTWCKDLPGFAAMAEKQLVRLADEIYAPDCQSVLPAPELVFAALAAVPPDRVRVVLLGEDPYPRKQSACGVAFLDAAVARWDQPGVRGSILHILKALAIAQGWASYGTALAEIRQRAAGVQGPLPAPAELFRSWQEQGVLLLNATLTFGGKDPASKRHHARFWQPFIHELLRQMQKQLRPCFVLWGGKASAALKAALGEQWHKADRLQQGHPAYQHQFLNPQKPDYSPFTELEQRTAIRWNGLP
jgi:uracil-DNA glycosylase